MIVRVGDDRDVHRHEPKKADLSAQGKDECGWTVSI